MYKWAFVWVHSYLHEITYNYAYIYVHIYVHVYIYIYILTVYMFGCTRMSACVMSIPDYGSAVMHSFCIYVCVFVFVFVCVCLFLLCFCHSSQSEERKAKESKWKQGDGMGKICVLYCTTRYVSCNVTVQTTEEVLNKPLQIDELGVRSVTDLYGLIIVIIF